MTSIAPLSLLIVEPDPALADVMRELLVRDGWKTIVVNALEHAVAALQAGRVDGVVIDADAMTSDEHVLALFAPYPGTRGALPPIIVVGVDATSLEKRPILTQTCRNNVRWLRKPFYNKEFLALVRTVVRPNNHQPA